MIGSKICCRVLLETLVSTVIESGREQVSFLNVPSHFPAVTTQAFVLVILEVSSGKANVFDAGSITVEGRLDVLVELIESFGPANGLLEVVELVLANQFSHSLLKKLVQPERASHSTFSRDKLRQLEAGLSLLDLVSDEVNSTATGITKNESVTDLNVTLIHTNMIQGHRVSPRSRARE